MDNLGNIITLIDDKERPARHVKDTTEVRSNITTTINDSYIQLSYILDKYLKY